MDFSFLPRFSTGVGVVAAAGAASVANADVRLSARILAWANQRWVSMCGGVIIGWLVASMIGANNRDEGGGT